MLWTYITLFKCISTHIVIPRKSSIGGNLPKFLPHHNIPSQIWSTACSIPTGIIQSCSPFTVGASQEPIRLVVERKLEKVWLRVIEPAFPFHVPLSLALFLTHRHTYAYANTHFQRHTHMQGTRKRVALGDRGLGERRMLAVKGPDPSFGNVEPLTLL